MKKSIVYIIFGLVIIAIIGVLVYMITSASSAQKTEFNLKEGEVLSFAKYATEVEILNIASSLCEEESCINPGEVEVSVKVYYNDEEYSYTLRSKNKALQRIENSNNYLILKYEDKKLSLEVKDKYEI